MQVSPKDLASLATEEIRAFIDSFDTVLCDCDGVLFHNDDTALPGSKEALEVLRKIGKRIIFVSNNSIMSVKDFYAKLRRLEFSPSDGDIVTPIMVAIDYLKQRNFKKKIYLFTISGLKQELEDAGFEIVDAHEANRKNLPELLKEIQDLDPEVGAVYFDFDFMYHHAAFQKAIQYLLKPDILLLGSGTDKIVRFSDGLKLVGPGYFHDIFTNVTGKEPIIFGKPSSYVNEFIKNKITAPSRTLFIGDSLEQDIYFAKRCGYKNLLVLSGITAQEDINKCKNDNYVPEYYVQDLNMLKSLLEFKQ